MTNVDWVLCPSCSSPTDNLNTEDVCSDCHNKLVDVHEHKERIATIAFLLDRKEQYHNSSGYHAFVEELIRDLASGWHINQLDVGEYDDLMSAVRRILG